MARRQLKDCRVIITGASSGIGQQLSVELAGRGARLLITARRADRLNTIVDQIRQSGGRAHAVAGDITDSRTRDQLLETARTELGGLDALINHAGVGAIGKFVDAEAARLRRVMEVNFFAPAELIRAAIPLLEQGTRPIIVNMASVLGHRAVPLKSEYCASKFALHGLSDSLRAELAKQAIDVLLVSPSTTDSEFFDRVLENQSGKDWKLSSAMSPNWVARKVIRAMEQGRDEVIIPWRGKWFVWLDRLFPSLANRIVARLAQ